MRTLLAAVILCLAGAGCAQTFVTTLGERHPPGGRFLVSAQIEEWPNGYYSTTVTIRNATKQPIQVDPSMFRLEGRGPTSFVPAGRMPLFMGRSGYRMPDEIAARTSVTGEIFFGIRGTYSPVGAVTLIVALPDGEHRFEFDLLQ
jgi:hypothetical protein